MDATQTQPELLTLDVVLMPAWLSDVNDIPRDLVELDSALESQDFFKHLDFSDFELRFSLGFFFGNSGPRRS